MAFGIGGILNNMISMNFEGIWYLQNSLQLFIGLMFYQSLYLVYMV